MFSKSRISSLLITLALFSAVHVAKADEPKVEKEPVYGDLPKLSKDARERILRELEDPKYQVKPEPVETPQVLPISSRAAFLGAGVMTQHLSLGDHDATGVGPSVTAGYHRFNHFEDNGTLSESHVSARVSPGAAMQSGELIGMLTAKARSSFDRFWLVSKGGCRVGHGPGAIYDMNYSSSSKSLVGNNDTNKFGVRYSGAGFCHDEGDSMPSGVVIAPYLSAGVALANNDNPAGDDVYVGAGVRLGVIRDDIYIGADASAERPLNFSDLNNGKRETLSRKNFALEVLYAINNKYKVGVTGELKDSKFRKQVDGAIVNERGVQFDVTVGAARSIGN